MIESLMAGIADWGAPALALILAVACFGVPFPSSLVLLAAGAIAADGDLSPVAVAGWGVAGSVAGDQAGYALGRLGGRGAVAAVSARYHLDTALARAEAIATRWGAIGVFLTRWLLSPAGPYVNVAAGMARMPWSRFTAAGLLGETVWVGLYAGLGYAFAGSIPAIADVLGNATWFLLAGSLAAALGWRLFGGGRDATATPSIGPCGRPDRGWTPPPAASAAERPQRVQDDRDVDRLL